MCGFNDKIFIIVLFQLPHLVLFSTLNLYNMLTTRVRSTTGRCDFTPVCRFTGESLVLSRGYPSRVLGHGYPPWTAPGQDTPSPRQNQDNGTTPPHTHTHCSQTLTGHTKNRTCWMVRLLLSVMQEDFLLSHIFVKVSTT